MRQGAGGRPPPRRWRRLFAGGLALWGLSVLATFATGSFNLIPTVVLLGSFLVPVTFVVWAYEQLDGSAITVETLFRGFVSGGVLGLIAASILETYLLRPSPLLYVGVGLIEEAVKLALVWYIGFRLPRKTLRDGLVLGGTVGFGFAAVESAGYALSALYTVEGQSLRELVETEIVRSLAAPVGHGLWTAILGGVLFAEAKDRRVLRLTSRVLTAYLGVAALHALWDSMHGLAVALTLVLTGRMWDYDLLEKGYLPTPTSNQTHLFTLLYWVGLAIITIIGLSWLARIRDRAELDELHDIANAP
ncbi:MAG: PrsW family intramembrane metalloprotease [Sporichthyaceae bacterium]|nr:PrsW family intramembrane metalloprotease [Sporichthyaceae bacterium]